MSNATLHLMCGKAASGKSTLSANLAKEHGGVMLAEDDYLPALYGDVMVTLKDYVHYSGKLKEAMKPLVLQLLSNGISVVLDFPANTTWQRDWLRGLVEESGCSHKLHFLNVSNEECKARLMERNQQGTHPFPITEKQFDDLTSYFVPPSADEGFNITIHQT